MASTSEPPKAAGGDDPTQLTTSLPGKGSLPETVSPYLEGDDPLFDELRTALAPYLQVVQRLGAGGMGTVYLGRDPVLKRLVAIKVLNPDLAHDESARLRFAREAEAAAAVGHPNVVSIFQVGILPTSGASYFVMQFVEGNTLGEEFPNGQPAANPVARRITGEIALALAAAHAKGLIHRDVKPSNVIIERDTGRTVVLDFGISAVREQLNAPDSTSSPKLTATGMYVGTPMYMSPEQASGQPATDKSDVYSLGVLAFELVAGHPPFTGGSALALIAAHLKDRVPSIIDERPDADPKLAQLIDACLSKDPAERPTAADVARFLLPSHQALEWPPPGLEKLRATGSGLTAALGASACFLWVLFATALLQSTRTMPCCWNDFEGSSVFGGVRSLVLTLLPMRMDETGLAAVYAMVIIACIVALPLMWIILARRAWTFTGEIRRARSAGYPWSVVLGVAWDRRADTAALYNGSDVFAVASEQQRTRFRRLRHWEAGLLFVAAAVALLLPVMWAYGLLTVSRSKSGPLLSLEDFFVLVMPVLVLLTAAAAVQHPEAKFRQRSRAKRRVRVRTSTPMVRPELVADWLGRAHIRRAKSRVMIPQSIVVILACLFVTPIAIAIAFSLGTILVAGRSMQISRQALDSFPLKARRAGWTAKREVFDSASALAQWNDDRARLIPVAFMAGASREDQQVLVDTALLRRYPADTAPWDESSHSRIDFQRLWATLPKRPADSIVALLRADTMSPGLAYWRAFAHSPMPSFLWFRRDAVRAGRPEDARARYRRATDLEFKFYEMASRNESAAALALLRGDKADAILRARENIAANWYLAQARPGREGFDEGQYFLQTLGRITKDSALIRAFEKLDNVATVRRDSGGRYLFREFNQPVPADLLFANVEHPEGLDWIGDPGLSPQIRWPMMTGVFTGFCLNPREILFGIDPRRRALADSAAHRARDLGHPSILSESALSRIDSAMTDPVGMAKAEWEWEMINKNGLLRVPDWIGLRKARARLSLCMAMDFRWYYYGE